jgi:rubrerythrin
MVVGAAVTMRVTVVMNAGLTMFMLVLGSFSAVVMRAGFAVHMLMPGGFCAVVVRAAFTVYMLVPGGFGAVVMRAAFAVYMLVLVFGFRGPYTAQLTKLFMSKMAGKLNYKHLVVVGEGLFSEKEFPSVAEGLQQVAQPYSFNSFFMKGQLRVATLTQEEQALLAKFSELTGMKITDMGEFSDEDAAAIADEIAGLADTLEVPEDPNAGQTKWICTVCGYVHTGDEPPEVCPMCKQPASVFKKME